MELWRHHLHLPYLQPVELHTPWPQLIRVVHFQISRGLKLYLVHASPSHKERGLVLGKTKSERVVPGIRLVVGVIH
jgi:hypothetical protein